MKYGEKDCPFCDRKEGLFVWYSFVAFYDKNPVTEGHVLLVPRKHVMYFDELDSQQQASLMNKVIQITDKLKSNDPTITGFNVGFNHGESAGQMVPHFHVHIIPRRDGDVDDPTGGVRGVIPSKQKY